MSKDISFTFFFSLTIEKEYDVMKINDLLKITPSKTWIKDKDHPKPLYRNWSYWQLSSNEIFDVFFHEPFSGFLDQFKNVAPVIGQLINQEGFSCKMDIVVKIYNGPTMPSINLNNQTIGVLSALKCSLDFDIYDYRKIHS